MAIVVVGGHARNVGKTSLVSSILAAWSQYTWTAIKISTHWHDRKDPAKDEGDLEICRVDEDFDRSGITDSARYLAAGASRSFWIRVQSGYLEEALPQLQPVIHSNPYVIIESNGVARLVQPDLFLMVLSCDVQDCKESARAMIPYAHALVVVNFNSDYPAETQLPLEAPPGIPVYPVENLRELPPGLMQFLSGHLD